MNDDFYPPGLVKLPDDYVYCKNCGHRYDYDEGNTCPYCRDNIQCPSCDYCQDCGMK